MGNRFNYRCPTCGSADEIEICAFVSIRLTDDGAAIAEEVHALAASPSCTDGRISPVPTGPPITARVAAACGYEGAVTGFFARCRPGVGLTQ